MLSKLELKLVSEKELSFQMVSLFHGALMELLPEEYAEELHVSKLHPYTQHLECREGIWIWIICCLNDKADNIIKEAVQKIPCIYLKKKQLKIDIVKIDYFIITDKELMSQLYKGDHSRYINVRFVSPTAFKQKGQYVFYPDMKCMFQSLMNKYDAAVEQNMMMDDQTLIQLCEHSKIIHYDLKSVNFSLEGIKIPAFIGKVTIKMSGTQTMTNFAHLLFLFGTFSGLGIKTALGMGSIELMKEGGSKCLQIDK